MICLWLPAPVHMHTGVGGRGHKNPIVTSSPHRLWCSQAIFLAAECFNQSYPREAGSLLVPLRGVIGKVFNDDITQLPDGNLFRGAICSRDHVYALKSISGVGNSLYVAETFSSIAPANGKEFISRDKAGSR